MYRSQQTGQCIALIFLKEITSVSRADLKSHCFELATKNKTFYLACRNDEDLYSWMDEIYNVSITKQEDPSFLAVSKFIHYALAFSAGYISWSYQFCPQSPR